MNKGVITALIVAVIVALVGFILINNSEEQVSETTVTTNEELNPVDVEGESPSNIDFYAAEEVAAHNSAEDCWTIVSDSVYDITSYVPRHPGGLEEIVLACGVDGTSLFLERQTADGQSVGSGAPHSTNAQNQLEPLKIGELAS